MHLKLDALFSFVLVEAVEQGANGRHAFVGFVFFLDIHCDVNENVYELGLLRPDTSGAGFVD